MLDARVRRVLDGASLAHLATVLPDGSPHTTFVYAGAYGDRAVFFPGPGMRKARNLRRDPRGPVYRARRRHVHARRRQGRVVEWIEGDAARDVVDQLAIKCTCAPYSRAQGSVVAVIEPDLQNVGIG